MDIGGDCGIVGVMVVMVTSVASVAALNRGNFFKCMLGCGIWGICSICGCIPSQSAS